MPRPSKDRPEGYELKHYGVYLDPMIDASLFEFIKPFADANRAGDIIRQALRAYIGQSHTSAPAIQIAAQTLREIPEPTSGSSDAKAMSRSMFIKGG